MKAILIKEVEIVAENYRQGCTLDYMNMSNRITRIRLLGITIYKKVESFSHFNEFTHKSWLLNIR